MKAKCKKCGDTVEVTRPREYKSCKCGAIALDYGDGENYYRACGNPEDFDGEIEGVPANLITTKTEPPHRQKKCGVALNEPTTEALVRKPDLFVNRQGIIIDTFWTEMAEHFRAMAELCERRSRL